MEQKTRRNLMTWALLPWLASCHALAGQGYKATPMSEVQQRFKGIGLVLVTDAVPGAEMLGVEFFADGRELPFYATSLLSRRTREIMSYPGGRIPETVRIVWRDNNKAIAPPGERTGISYGGRILGDYTIPVATRIPNAALQDIRSRGGALRLKFRLKPHGVLFGWDIERDGGGISRFDMPGGDFTETRY
jgi:hypothetical protein